MGGDIGVCPSLLTTDREPWQGVLQCRHRLVADLAVVKVQRPQGRKVEQGSEVGDLGVAQVQLVQGGKVREWRDVAELVRSHLRNKPVYHRGGKLAQVELLKLSQPGEWRQVRASHSKS